MLMFTMSIVFLLFLYLLLYFCDTRVSLHGLKFIFTYCYTLNDFLWHSEHQIFFIIGENKKTNKQQIFKFEKLKQVNVNDCFSSVFNFVESLPWTTDICKMIVRCDLIISIQYRWQTINYNIELLSSPGPINWLNLSNWLKPNVLPPSAQSQTCQFVWIPDKHLFANTTYARIWDNYWLCSLSVAGIYL